MHVRVIGISKDFRSHEQREHWLKMEVIRQTYKKLGVEVPTDVSDYLAQHNAPCEVDLSAALDIYNVYKSDGQESRIEISLKDVPENVETIRIVV